MDNTTFNHEAQQITLQYQPITPSKQSLLEYQTIYKESEQPDLIINTSIPLTYNPYISLITAIPQWYDYCTSPLKTPIEDNNKVAQIQMLQIQMDTYNQEETCKALWNIMDKMPQAVTI